MFQQPSAVRPATGPTNSVAHPSIRGFKQPSATRPATGPTNPVAHPSIRGHAVLLKRRSLKNRPKSTPAHGSVATAVSHKHHSIIRVGAGLIQFVHARTCSSVAEAIPIKILFRSFFRGSMRGARALLPQPSHCMQARHADCLPKTKFETIRKDVCKPAVHAQPTQTSTTTKRHSCSARGASRSRPCVR